jgi:hypothetical protein
VKIAQSSGVAVALALCVGLVASACAGYGSAASNPSAAESDAVTLNIAAPSDGAQVKSPFEVQLDSSVPLGAPESGQRHVHLYYDTPTPTGEYDLVYGNQAQVTALTPGTHTILASLRNANHSDAGPRALITVTVDGAVEGAPQTGSGNTPEDPYAY